jgi:ABC-type uncharacterized transport system auxiliary subunit
MPAASSLRLAGAVFAVSALSALSGLLGGCGTPPQSLTMELSQADVLQLRTWVPEGLKQNVDLERVKGGESTSMWWGSKLSALTLEQALEDSLRNLGMLPPSPQLPALYQLRTQIVSLVQPLVAADTTVTVTINYTLIERASGAVLYQRAVRTSHKTDFGDSMLSMPDRTRLANEGAVRQNIIAAMRDLMALRVPEPARQ